MTKTPKLQASVIGKTISTLRVNSTFWLLTALGGGVGASDGGQHNVNTGGSGGAIAMSDSIDGGLEIKSSTTNMSLIDFAPSDAAKIRPFNYNGCVQITTAKLTNVTNAIMRIGMRSNYRTEAGSYVRIQLYGAAGGAHGSQENIISINSDNFSVTNTDITSSSTPSMFDWLTHKIECKSSTTEYSINGILKVTASGIPDEQLMPFIEVKNEEGTAASNPIVNVRYMECYNT